MIPLTNLWFGVIEDANNDPYQMGRVKVRVIGVHTENKSLLPTEDLPWAEVLSGINSASISGVGLSAVGLVNRVTRSFNF